MSFCDYTIESGDDCGRPAWFKFIATDLAHYACQTHEQPMYRFLRCDKAPYSVIISLFIPSSERAAERCQHPGCVELAMPAMNGDLDLALCQDHWAPWCEDDACDQPGQYELRIEAPHEGYEPSNPMWACPDHLGAVTSILARDWHSLGVSEGRVLLQGIVRP